MSQLEIGELSIASFGEEMRIIHPFSKHFIFDSGVDCVRNFTFVQKGTRTVRKCICLYFVWVYLHLS